jgi:UDP-glucose 4-epimerase
MRALITGCAGFIGSNLTDRLLNEGFEVIGIDRFSDYYSSDIKENNLFNAQKNERFSLIEEDIAEMETFPDADYVFHLAAQAGVRASWGKSFDIYTHDNIQTTQRLLEYYKGTIIKKFVYSSSSSVYGNVSLPMHEGQMLRPVSPYGVSKLAAEHLCYLYWKNYGVPVISLRYFTVYGPRQRPDMGINKFFKAIQRSDPITIFGDGNQTRDFTFIDDVVEANLIAALCNGVSGEAFNIGGGNRISVQALITTIEEVTGETAHIIYGEEQKGDVQDTWADTEKAERLLSWRAEVRIPEGLKRYYQWILSETDHGNIT